MITNAEARKLNPQSYPPVLKTGRLGKHERPVMLISAQNFDTLPEYSSTMPTGVYLGKLWKRDMNWQRVNHCWEYKQGAPPDWVIGSYEPHPTDPKLACEAWYDVEVRTLIGLVACCKTKLDHPAAAEEMYTSRLFQLSREYVKRHCASWYVLSAKYGLVPPDQGLDPYDFTLNGVEPGRRRAWANRQNKALCDLFKPDVLFVVLAGKEYRRALEYTVRLPYEDPLAGMGIGKRIAWLQAALREEKVA